MRSAAIRYCALVALTSWVAALAAVPSNLPPASGPVASDNNSPPVAVRAAPSRPMVAPALPPGLRLGRTDYVSATDLAQWLGFKVAWLDPQKKLALSDGVSNRAELVAEGRETLINGLRVFLGHPTALRDGKLYVSRIDALRCLAPLLRPGFGATLPAPVRTIVLDPGHGGNDPGTENKALGLREKILTLDVAQRAKKILEAAGFKVLLTRTADEALSANKMLDLALRPDFARREKADLFVSIHFNASAKDTRGTEVFTFAPRQQSSTDSWGMRLDDSETEEAPGNKFDHWNVVLAAAMHRNLLQTLKTEDRGKKIAHWAVLRTLTCPGVLIEPAIITNESDARRVATPEFRQQIAEALAAGVRQYVAALEPLRSNPSPAPGGSPAR